LTPGQRKKGLQLKGKEKNRGRETSWKLVKSKPVFAEKGNARRRASDGQLSSLKKRRLLHNTEERGRIKEKASVSDKIELREALCP